MRTREIACEYSPYIMQPPVKQESLYSKACTNDGATVNVWKDKWLANIEANKKRFGSFADKSLGNLFGKFLHRPVIIAGSGPSLKYNIDDLKDNKGIPIVSCLHNFHYFEDNGVKVDYYVTLDAGPVTIEEVSEGGNKTEEEYWEITKDRTLLAFIGTHPDLLKKWQGEIYFYNALIPDEDYREKQEAIEKFRMWVSNGGNVLGACLYISKAIMGAGTSIFIGADFCFGYDKKFHSWDSKYDAKMGYCIPATDVFGNRVATWQSYANFKAWFDWVAIRVPGHYINASEGGTLGAYPEGNLINIKQMDLKDVVEMYSMSEKIKDQCLDPKLDDDKSRIILF